jgi:rod shape-determining protein MreB
MDLSLQDVQDVPNVAEPKVDRKVPHSVRDNRNWFARKKQEAITTLMTTARKVRGHEDLAIDLGTDNSSVFVPGKGIVKVQMEDLVTKQLFQTSQIPSLAILMQSERAEHGEEDFKKEGEIVFATGSQAYEMLGRLPPGLVSFKPVENGNIAHRRAYRANLRDLIRLQYPQFDRKFPAPAPRILIGIPHCATEYHRAYIKDLIEKDLGGVAMLAYEQIADAIGAGLPFRGPQACFVGNSGGGTFDIAILAMGKVIDQKSFIGAGDAMDRRIQTWVRKISNVEIGIRTATWLKENLGSAIPFEKEDFPGLEIPTTATVCGSDIRTEAPAEVTIHADELRACLIEEVENTVGHIRSYWASLHQERRPEIQGDIMKNGLYFSGGSSKLYGFAKYIEKALGIPVWRVQDPEETVIAGLGAMLEDDDLYELGRAI